MEITIERIIYKRKDRWIDPWFDVETLALLGVDILIAGKLRHNRILIPTFATNVRLMVSIISQLSLVEIPVNDCVAEKVIDSYLINKVTRSLPTVDDNLGIL